MARDITEGDGNVWSLAGDGLPIARGMADIGIVSTGALWQNTDISYDVAIGGIPLVYAISDARPYIRQTAPYKKDQFDNGAEPGEQSLTGWWLRSQSSFHSGDGIKFYDPSAGETSNYRFADSKGVDIWTKGQVSLLKSTSTAHYTTGPIESTTSKPVQHVRSIRWDSKNAILLHDEYDVDKIETDGTTTHFIDYASGTAYKVYAICDDGVNAYWITKIDDAGVIKTAMYKKPLSGSTTTGPADETQMWKDSSNVVTKATMEFVKDRIVVCINNKIHEISAGATSLPTAVYTHPDSDVTFTSITASGAAIYVSGFSGIQSSIYKFTLNTSGAMPSLTTAITAAEMPVGERIYKIYYYLGYLMIGTDKGIRAAVVSDTDGSINYGPLIMETTQPCYDFAARDKFVWCATGVEGTPGVIRIDLGNDIETLRFAYANDLYVDGITGYATTACAFSGNTNQLVFCTTALNAGTIINKALTSNVATLTTSLAHGLVAGDSIWVEGVDSTFNGKYTVVDAPTTTTFTYAKTASNVSSTAVSSSTALVNKTGTINIESASTLRETGYLTTGYIRYATLEPKNFKRIIGRGDFTYGTMAIETVDKDGVEYDHITYSVDVPAIEVSTLQPDSAQEYVAYKFVFTRDATSTSNGPIFKGYQAKATIATPRQQVMRFPVYCYDTETDRFNVEFGYSGRALDVVSALEDMERSGDVVTLQDLTTNESRQVVIEQLSLTRTTPPDRASNGFGGIYEITVRTV